MFYLFFQLFPQFNRVNRPLLVEGLRRQCRHPFTFCACVFYHFWSQPAEHLQAIRNLSIDCKLKTKYNINAKNTHYQSTVIVLFDWEIVQIAENPEMSITDPQDPENVEESKGKLEEHKPDEMQLHMALQVQILDEVMWVLYHS